MGVVCLQVPPDTLPESARARDPRVPIERRGRQGEPVHRVANGSDGQVRNGSNPSHMRICTRDPRGEIIQVVATDGLEEDH